MFSLVTFSHMSHLRHTPFGVSSNEDRQRRARGSAPRALYHCANELQPRVPGEAGQRTPAAPPPVSPPLYRLVKAKPLRGGPKCGPALTGGGPAGVPPGSGRKEWQT